MKHELESSVVNFEAVLSGDKRFHICYDEGYQKGDLVKFVEKKSRYPTGRELDCKITFVSPFHQKEGWTVFGFDILKKDLVEKYV